MDITDLSITPNFNRFYIQESASTYEQLNSLHFKSFYHE